MLPSRKRATIGAALPTTTIADVARGTGLIRPDEVLRADQEVLIDGRPTAVAQRLIASPIRHGSRLDIVVQPTDRVHVTSTDLPRQPVPGAALRSAASDCDTMADSVCDVALGVAIEVVWITGPDAGAVTALGAGSHLVGRSASAAVRCADQALEPHHAVLDVNANGSLSLTQLAGLQPILVDGVVPEQPAPLVAGARVCIGASQFVIRRPRPAPAAAARGAVSNVTVPIRYTGNRPDPWRFPLVRTPRALRSFRADAIEAPRRQRSPSMFAGGLLPTIIGLSGAAGMAVLFDQLMFLMFGALGALVAIGTWVAQKVGIVRTRTTARREYEQAATAFAAALGRQRGAFESVHRDSVPTIEASLLAMHHHTHNLWAVRASDPNAFTISLGEGDLVWRPNVTGLDRDTAPEIHTLIEHSSILRRLPIPASLGPGTVTALVGGHDAVAVARAMIVQLAAASGPADWRLALVTDRPELWNGLTWLPHIIESGGAVRIAGANGSADLIGRLDDDQRHLLVVVDQPEQLGTRTSALRRLLSNDPSIAAIVVCEGEDTVPAVATSALMIGRLGSARWIADTHVAALAEPVRFAGLSTQGALDAAAAIACLIDPEVAGGLGGLPAHVSMTELLGDELGDERASWARRIAAHWEAADHDPAPAAPIGVAADGVIEIDLVRDGPHGLLAGTTGAGKSELLRSLVVGLATRLSPEHVTFVLVDYKGGATFDACAGLPHIVGVVTDLDDRLAARALRSLEAELRRRERILREAGTSDLAGYRSAGYRSTSQSSAGNDDVQTGVGQSGVGSHDASCGASSARRDGGGRERRDPLPRLVVVVDEFAALSVAQPDFIRALLGIAQRGRSLGVHLLLATQRPNGIVNDEIRANTNLRVSLRVHDRADSIDVIGDHGAAGLARSIPGRAIMRLGVDELIMFQTACCTEQFESGAGSAASELEILVCAIRQAVELSGIAAPHRPWLPALGAERSHRTDGVQDGGGLHAGLNAIGLGVIDDPDRQRRLPLLWSPAAGHLLLAGASGSGTTTALLAIAAFVSGPPGGGPGAESVGADLFVIDAMGDARLHMLASLESCVAVVQVHETERLLRMLATLAGEVVRRKAEPDVDQRREIVVMIDGFGALRAELERLDLFEQLDQIETIVADGHAVGISVVAATAKPAAVSTGMLGQIANRWVFHLVDPLDASLLGVAPGAVPAAIAGRMIESGTGREGQVNGIGEQHVLELLQQSTGRGFRHRRVEHPPLSVLPAEVDFGELPFAVASGGDAILPIGLSFDSLTSTQLPIASGEHVLVLGPSRSGRTTALHTLARSWQQLHPSGWVGSVSARRSSARSGAVFADVVGLLAALPGEADPPRLIVIDDAELVDDPTGALAAMVADRREGLTVLAAGSPQSLRTCYGHWTLAVRRSRLGFAMAACSGLDADLLSVSVPRRLPIPARPGLAWLVADGGRHLVQIARCHEVESSAAVGIAGGSGSHGRDRVLDAEVCAP